MLRDPETQGSTTRSTTVDACFNADAILDRIPARFIGELAELAIVRTLQEMVVVVRPDLSDLAVAEDEPLGAA